MEEKGWYNGYGWSERYAKLKALKRRIAEGLLLPAQPPCQLCGDPEPKAVEYHDEDYSKEYEWKPPALFVLCRNCHRTQLHKRFSRPNAWRAFVAHVLRGGYARDLAEPQRRREVKLYESCLHAGQQPLPLIDIPGRSKPRRPAWYEALSLDPIQTTPLGKRPRP